MVKSPQMGCFTMLPLLQLAKARQELYSEEKADDRVILMCVTYPLPRSASIRP